MRWSAWIAALCFALLLPVVATAEDTESIAPEAVGEAPLFSAGPFEYRPGRGLRVGDTGLVIGGFTNLKVEDTEHADPEFALDNLNVFFIFDRFPRFRAVAELQFRDIFVADGEHAGTQDFAFDVRRLFGDYTLTNSLNVRVGTFLTPFGYWNLILAPPLTWTTEAPLIVEETFFEQTTTGLMLHGAAPALDGTLGYAVFSQLLHPLEDDPDLDPPDQTAGLRLTYERGPSWSVGASFQAARNNGEWSYAGGPYLLWLHRRGEVLSELYAQGGPALPSEQWGAYVQGVLEVYHPFYLVGRYEHFDQPTPDPTLNLFTVGAVWKPFPFMAVKAEYRFVDRSVPDEGIAGFFASFTTFF